MAALGLRSAMVGASRLASTRTNTINRFNFHSTTRSMTTQTQAKAQDWSASQIQFSVADLKTYTPEKLLDLVFSNAVFQWLKADERVPMMKRMIQWLRPGGVLAIQVLDNYLEPSHIAMRAFANEDPWASILGPLSPALDQFATPQQFYDELSPLCSSVDIWHTLYQHPLDDHQSLVEWVKGTGLRPFLNPLGSEDREAFAESYLTKLKEVYQVSVDGKVLLRYPRLL
ncbi:hypothetical protein MRS44_011537 [Fusarium solani]|uniref:uncharacterized protein n=1 Tax=Fusarium solani TaxID=169388 RepID=UPI0032C41A96|nr:hypothetical protein MRS44_011537 [Fusarium solani]